MNFRDRVSCSEVYACFLVFLLRSRQEPVDCFPVILESSEEEMLDRLHARAIQGLESSSSIFNFACKLMVKYDSSVYTREVDTPMVRFLIAFSLKGEREFDAPSVVARSIESLLWCMRCIVASCCMENTENTET